MEIIKADEAKALISNGNTVIADARGGPDAYDRFVAKHVKNAVFVDLETELSAKSENAADGGRHPLPDPAVFGQLLSQKGILKSTAVIIYDDKKGANAAARFWWMLKAAGHEKAYVVSGGLESLESAGFELTSEISVVSPQAMAYEVEEWKLPLVNTEQVTSVTENDDYLIIDVRENYRYRGESEPIDLIAGHIPGAVNIPYTTNLDETGEFLTTEKLTEKYTNALKGRRPENVIVHCGSGVTACHTLLALAEAGIAGAGLYVGSWSEWSRNSLPVATED
jgi:thiosulfate/3-mercaptopyruvate sulfurtransferase